MTHLHDTETSQTRLTEHSAQADLRTLLQLCAAGRVKCSATTLRPSAATVAQVAEVLDAGDFYAGEPIAAFAWPLLLQAGGLAQLAAGKLALTKRGQQALTQPAHKVLAGLWQRWLSSTVLDEFSRVEAIKGQRSANVLSALKPRRGHVGAALAALAPDQWTTVDQLFTAMRNAGHNPSVARSERALWKLYLEDPEYGSLGYDGHHPWTLLQGRYTMAVLFEYAAPLGLIDVEYTDPAGARDDHQHNWGGDWLERISRYDGLRAIRLTPLGAYATGQASAYLPGPAPESTTAGSATGLKILPNHDLVALDGLPPAQALLLDAFATRTGDRTWTLSPASLLAAVHAGRNLSELRTYLNHADTALPDTVTTLLTDAERRVGQVRDLGPVHLIECADAATCALLASDRRIRALATRLGDRHLGVHADKLDRFRKATLTLGHPII
ncbi:helicase-associated domain-containing protein [Streptomyces sp. NBC_01264]|uniref:helicase-associated domain-containing protein n=1 Tax=Streptomyces sp. NBC_01264 TaxID=2903804 RepID=UPI00224EBB1B|nr:helicase-associated domain-containing protein [Streptomyces sp. NBC_01264]MCX4783453.1 helicase-associated domain-containing protein [Streptomyces sp. NBC_01264]